MVILETMYKGAHVPLERYFHLLPTMPNGETVEDLLEKGFPQVKNMVDGLLIGAGLTAFRILQTEMLLKPLGQWAMKHRYDNHQPNLELDAVLARKKYPDREDYQQIAKKQQLSEAQVKAYFRASRNHAREQVALKKFTEALWKFQAYFFCCVYGFTFVLGQQGWMWDTVSCWSGYPTTVVPRSIYWYYMIELGVYMHELVNVFTDARRKDFAAMVTHHISTLVLITGSYVVNFMPIGSLVMVVHDVADVFLEAAKLFNYVTKARPWAQKVTDVLFVCFALVFFASRLVVFPSYVLRSALVDGWAFVGDYKGLYVLDGFLIVLQCLHAYWMFLILRVAARMAIKGKADKDDRSDDGSDLEDEETMDEKKRH